MFVNSDQLFENQLCACNNGLITPKFFSHLLEKIDHEKPSYAVLTNYYPVLKGIFEWLGLEEIGKVYNHNSGYDNYVFCGKIKKDRLEIIVNLPDSEFISFMENNACLIKSRVKRYFSSLEDL